MRQVLEVLVLAEYRRWPQGVAYRIYLYWVWVLRITRLLHVTIPIEWQHKAPAEPTSETFDSTIKKIVMSSLGSVVLILLFVYKSSYIKVQCNNTVFMVCRLHMCCTVVAFFSRVYAHEPPTNHPLKNNFVSNAATEPKAMPLTLHFALGMLYILSAPREDKITKKKLQDATQH